MSTPVSYRDRPRHLVVGLGVPTGPRAPRAERRWTAAGIVLAPLAPFRLSLLASSDGLVSRLQFGNDLPIIPSGGIAMLALSMGQ